MAKKTRRRIRLWFAAHPWARPAISMAFSATGLALAFVLGWGVGWIAFWAFFLGVDVAEWGEKTKK